MQAIYTQRLNTYARLIPGRHAMKGYLANLENLSMDFEALPIQAVALSHQHFDQAVEISDRVLTEPRQWQTYLNALALFALQDWLAEQAPDLTLDWQQCSLLKPQYANLIEAVYDLQINNFKLCLVATGHTVDSVIKLPRAVVDLADFRAHLYILVRVSEENSQAQVLSFLRYDQWLVYCQTNPLIPEPDWTYSVPLQWFDDDLHRLLLYLQCLETQALPSLKPELDRAKMPNRLQQNLAQRLAQAPSVATPLWQLLTWEEGALVLTQPPLVDWLYQVQTGQLPLKLESEADSSSVLQPILDAGAWLRNELDEMAQALGWLLLPSLAEMRSLDSIHLSPSKPIPLGSALQPIADNIELIRRQLAREGTNLPPDTRGVYKTVTLANTPLELYAITWQLRNNQGQPVEWALLLVLKSLTNNSTHPAITLSVSDSTALLVEHRLTAGSDRNSVYAQVAGSWDEEFRVMLTADSGETLVLPTITFRQGEE